MKNKIVIISLISFFLVNWANANENIDSIKDNFIIEKEVTQEEENIEEPKPKPEPEQPKNNTRSWGWWWGGFVRLKMDDCPDWDNSPSYYDNSCEAKKIEETIIKETEEEEKDEIIEFNSAPEKQNNENSKWYTQKELNQIKEFWYIIQDTKTLSNIKWETKEEEELIKWETVKKVSSEINQLPKTGTNELILLLITLLIGSIIFYSKKRIKNI